MIEQAARVLWVDVCGTLYEANTTAGFVSWHLERVGRHWRLGLLKLLSSRKTPFRICLIALGKLLGKDLLRSMHIASLKNEHRKALKESAASYCEQQIASLAIAPVHRLVDQMKADGWTPVLVSNSLDVVVSALGDSMGLSSLASRLDFGDELCEGRLADDLKGRKLEAFLSRYPGELDKSCCAVVTDNRSDRDLIMASSQVFLVGKRRLPWMDQYEAQFIDYSA